MSCAIYRAIGLNQDKNRTKSGQGIQYTLQLPKEAILKTLDTSYNSANTVFLEVTEIRNAKDQNET